MLKEQLRTVYFSIGALCIFLLGLATGSLLTQVKPQNPDVAKSRELHDKGKLTSPLLDCDVPTDFGNKEYVLFQQKLTDTINTLTKQGKISNASVYYRHLMDGAWFGINENTKFSPSSLLKVPNMITLLKMAESDPSILEKQLLYEKVQYAGQPFFGQNTTLVLGQSYTVNDLITRMITQSDNEAMFLLRDKFDAKVFNKLYVDLNITPPNDAVSDDLMTIKTYTAFFRILYNASYLSLAMSEKALTLLTNVTFKKGLVAGLPNTTSVAHKFGERTYVGEDTKELHDCGIIYHPTDPYLLCIMTTGKDFDTLSGIIRDISKSVWDEVETQKK
jgi:beta-lactamase class A